MIRHLSIVLILIVTTLPCNAEPIEISHVYGTTIIEKPPARVVSLSYIGHDFLLALDVIPVGLRYWYGQQPYAVWPWGQEALGDAEPTVLYGNIDVEQVALLKPDLIEGQWSGMTKRDYELLSQIAPTLPPAVGESEYTSPWQTMLHRVGLATDRVEKAEEITTRINERFVQFRTQHPQWQEMTAAVAWPSQVGAFASPDLRSKFLADLGFTVPQDIDDLVRGNNFYVIVPPENLDPIDTDLLIWSYAVDAIETLDKIKLRPMMRAKQEEREILLDEILSAALSHSSPLSLDFALDHLAPIIAAATDGDTSSHAKTDHARTIGAKQ